MIFASCNASAWHSSYGGTYLEHELECVQSISPVRGLLSKLKQNLSRRVPAILPVTIRTWGFRHQDTRNEVEERHLDP